MEYGLVAVWLVAYLTVGAATLPLAAAVFSRFRDSGASFTVPLGLATIGVVGYLVGQIAFGLPALLAGLVAILAASVRFGDPDAIEWRPSAEVAVVFTAAFLFLVAVRASSPAIAPLPIAAGEKFLDYGLLNSLLRGSTLPPTDMWFAGEPVKYYYGGQLLTALLAILTGTAPQFAYNLALAGFYASLVTAVYGLAGSISAAHGGPRRLAAIAGGFFVGIAGNLHTAAAVAAWLLPDGLVAALPGVTAESALLTWGPTDFFYWDASRVIEGTINEFPLFAWLNGDLHAHMLSTPFTLLVAALCYSYWRTPESELRRRRAILGSIAPVVGLLAITNTWDFPVAGGLVALTVAFAPPDPATLLPASLSPRAFDRSILEELRRDGLGLAAALVVLLCGGAVVAPFWLASASARGIGFLPPRSGMGSLLIVHGGFLLLFVPYLLGGVDSRIDRRGGVYGVVALGSLAAWAAGFAAVALFGPLLLSAWVLLRDRTDAEFETVLLLGGIGLVLLVEFVHVVEPQYQTASTERLNTVFKVYSQVWVLWAPAAGVVAARLFNPTNALGAVATPRWRSVGTAVVCVAVVSTGLYAGFAVPAHLADGPVGADGPTLDGEAYLDSTYPDEEEAIAWLDDRPGQPTIVTAAPGGYQWRPADGEGASAPASLTGVPTVLGWMHEEQYRGSEPYTKRLDDVTAIYEGEPGTQSALFDRYDVEYVYVGPAERARYDLTVESHPRLTPAFESGDVVVYAVR